MKKFLYKYLPYLPVSLPVLLFCRLAELTAMLESETLLSRADWEAAVHEKILLSWVANDVKIIGMYNILFLEFCTLLHVDLSSFQKQSQSPLDSWSSKESY